MTVELKDICPNCGISQKYNQEIMSFINLLSKDRGETDPYYKYIQETAKDLFEKVGNI